MGGWAGGWAGERVGGVGGWLGGWVAGWVGGWVAGWVAGWMGGWVGAWVGGLVGGWVGGWVGESPNAPRWHILCAAKRLPCSNGTTGSFPKEPKLWIDKNSAPVGRWFTSVFSVPTGAKWSGVVHPQYVHVRVLLRGFVNYRF